MFFEFIICFSGDISKTISAATCCLKAVKPNHPQLPMKKILVISIDKQLLSLLQSNLRVHGFEVATISETDNLLNKIQAADPYLLLIDFVLDDGCNAAALCHQLKSNPDLKYIPIITLSDLPKMDTFALKFGSYAVVHKPVIMTELLKNIHGALEESTSAA
jgi:DNA-binding response OmpR family regulator